MNSLEKIDHATVLLKEINCPEPILDALFVFRFAVEIDLHKLQVWSGFANNTMVEGRVLPECKKQEIG